MTWDRAKGSGRSTYHRWWTHRSQWKRPLGPRALPRPGFSLLFVSTQTLCSEWSELWLYTRMVDGCCRRDSDGLLIDLAGRHSVSYRLSGWPKLCRRPTLTSPYDRGASTIDRIVSQASHINHQPFFLLHYNSTPWPPLSPNSKRCVRSSWTISSVWMLACCLILCSLWNHQMLALFAVYLGCRAPANTCLWTIVPRQETVCPTKRQS